MKKALGTFRAFYLVALCCVGSFLFAYDTGIVGGILTFPSFQRDFQYTTKDKANVGSLSTSLLQAGGECIYLSVCCSCLLNEMPFCMATVLLSCLSWPYGEEIYN